MTREYLIERLQQWHKVTVEDGRDLDILELAAKAIQDDQKKFNSIRDVALSCYDSTHMTAASPEKMAFVLGQIIGIIDKGTL